MFNKKKLYTISIIMSLCGFLFFAGLVLASCWDECSYDGQTEEDGNQIRTCGNYDADYCLEWSVWKQKPIASPTPPTCWDECSYDGQTEEDGDQIRTCGNYDADYCLEWSAWEQKPTASPTPPTCWDECSYDGQTEEDGDQIRTCGNYDTDYCLEWSAWEQKPPVPPTCWDECSYDGKHECLGTSGKTCGNYDIDYCLEWSSLIQCDSLCYSCVDGTCNSSCGENSNNCSLDCGTIIQGNNSPVVNAGLDLEVEENQTIGLLATATDPDGDSLLYDWSCSGGNVSNIAIINPIYTAPLVDNDTTYSCIFSANDGKGGIASDNLNILVKNTTTTPPNPTPPTPTPTPTPAVLGTVVLSLGSGVSYTSDSALSVTTLVRNTTFGETEFSSSTNANLSNRLEFKVSIKSTGTSTAEYVRLKDIFPENVKFSGFVPPSFDSSKNLETGFGLGNLAPNKEINFEFEAVVGGFDDFKGEQKTMENQFIVSAAGIGNIISTTTINVFKSKLEGIAVNKNIRSRTKDSEWINSLTVIPEEEVSFLIEVNSNFLKNVENLNIKETLPSGIKYIGNLKINGEPVEGDIISGINIGSLSFGDKKQITFDAVVEDAEKFKLGTNDLATLTSLQNNDISNSYFLNFKVRRAKVAGVATDVVTGINVVPFVFMLSLFLSLMLYLLLKRLEYSNNPYFNKFEAVVSRLRIYLFR